MLVWMIQSFAVDLLEQYLALTPSLTLTSDVGHSLIRQHVPYASEAYQNDPIYLLEVDGGALMLLRSVLVTRTPCEARCRIIRFEVKLEGTKVVSNTQSLQPSSMAHVVLYIPHMGILSIYFYCTTCRLSKAQPCKWARMLCVEDMSLYNYRERYTLAKRSLLLALTASDAPCASLQ